MNDEMRINVSELTPEEEAAIDRILREHANAENDGIDYAAIHDAILRKAREEGISVFAKPAKPAEKGGKAGNNEKPERKAAWVRYALTGLAAAAAVFVIGFAMFTILRDAFGTEKRSGQTAYTPDDGRPADGVVSSAEPAVRTEGIKGTSTPGIATFDPAVETHSTDTIPEPTPIPTEYPVRGGVGGYVELASFTAEPADSTWLIPAELPEYMPYVCSETELFVTAAGKSEEGVSRYECRILRADDSLANASLGIGCASYQTNEFSGTVKYLWRVTEESWLSVEFAGFDREQAEEILLSLPLCDLTALETEAAA